VTRCLGTALTVAWVLSSWGCRSTQHYFKRGDEFYRSGHYQEAALNYRKALQKDPNFGDAYLGLGLSEFKQQHFTQAWQYLNRAVDLLPDSRTAKVDLGELCLDGLIQDPRRPKNLYQRLGAISDQLLAQDSNSFAGLRFKGYLALIDGRMEEAVRDFRKAVQIAPKQPDVVISLVEALFQNQQDQEAERVARGFIESRKSHGAAYDALYVHYVNKGRFADAEQILRLKVANNPDEPAYVKQLCEFYWRSGRQAQALDLIEKLPKNPGSTAAYLAAGDFYSSIERWDDAAAQFQEGIRVAPAERVLFQKKIANGLIAQGKKEQAASTVDEILKQQPKDQEALRLRADLRLSSKEGAAVAASIEDYKTLLRQNSRDPRVHYGLGRAFQLKGDFPSAKAELHQAVQLDANYAAPRLALIEIALAQHKSDEAIQWADVAISADSRNTTARLMKALALREAGRLNDSRVELEQVIKAAPQEKSAYLQLGLLEIEEKNFNKAEDLFAKLQSLGGDVSSAAAGLAVLYSKEGQLEKAYGLLKKALEHSPDHLLVHELLATVAMQAHQFDRAIAEYHAFLLIKPNDVSIHLRLAEAFRLKGDFNSYVSTLERAQKLFPGDLMATVLLASAMESVGQEDVALKLYRHAQELQPADPRVLNNLAYAIIETNGNIDEAMRLAQFAVKNSPDQPRFADTLGCVYLKKNLTDGAVQLFRTLVKKHPDDPTFRYHLGAALFQKGDVEGARVALKVALGNKPAKDEADQIRQLLARLN
jgi:tetratricopeptide (TPR) repeat protein